MIASVRIVAAALLAAVGTLGLMAEAHVGRAMAQEMMIGGHFRLTDTDGRIVDSDTLAGKPYGLFFGFTNCPNVCPTTLSDLSQAMQSLPATTDLRVFFVTVDPERDTPAALKQYMSSFDPHLVGLSGDRPAVDEAIRSYGIIARRTAFPDGTYAYTHTASVMLVDGDGLVVDRLSASDDPSVLATRLRAFADPRQAAGR